MIEKQSIGPNDDTLPASQIDQFDSPVKMMTGKKPANSSSSTNALNSAKIQINQGATILHTQ